MLDIHGCIVWRELLVVQIVQLFHMVKFGKQGDYFFIQRLRIQISGQAYRVLNPRLCSLWQCLRPKKSIKERLNGSNMALNGCRGSWLCLKVAVPVIRVYLSSFIQRTYSRRNLECTLSIRFGIYIFYRQLRKKLRFAQQQRVILWLLHRLY